MFIPHGRSPIVQGCRFSRLASVQIVIHVVAKVQRALQISREHIHGSFSPCTNLHHNRGALVTGAARPKSANSGPVHPVRGCTR